MQEGTSAKLEIKEPQGKPALAAAEQLATPVKSPDPKIKARKALGKFFAACLPPLLEQGKAGEGQVLRIFDELPYVQEKSKLEEKHSTSQTLDGSVSDDDDDRLSAPRLTEYSGNGKDEDEDDAPPLIQNSGSVDVESSSFVEFQTGEIQAAIHSLVKAKTKEEFDKRAYLLAYLISTLLMDGRNPHPDVLPPEFIKDPIQARNAIQKVFSAYLSRVVHELVDMERPEKPFQIWLRSLNADNVFLPWPYLFSCTENYEFQSVSEIATVLKHHAGGIFAKLVNVFDEKGQFDEQAPAFAEQASYGKYLGWLIDESILQAQKRNPEEFSVIERVRVIEWWINVAEELVKQQDYHSSRVILFRLTDTYIFRKLPTAWGTVSPANSAKLAKLQQQIMNPQEAFTQAMQLDASTGIVPPLERVVNALKGNVKKEMKGNDLGGLVRSLNVEAYAVRRAEDSAYAAHGQTLIDTSALSPDQIVDKIRGSKNAAIGGQAEPGMVSFWRSSPKSKQHIFLHGLYAHGHSVETGLLREMGSEEEEVARIKHEWAAHLEKNIESLRQKKLPPELFEAQSRDLKANNEREMKCDLTATRVRRTDGVMVKKNATGSKQAEACEVSDQCNQTFGDRYATFISNNLILSFVTGFFVAPFLGALFHEKTTRYVPTPPPDKIPGYGQRVWNFLTNNKLLSVVLGGVILLPLIAAAFKEESSLISYDVPKKKSNKRTVAAPADKRRGSDPAVKPSQRAVGQRSSRAPSLPRSGSDPHLVRQTTGQVGEGPTNGTSYAQMPQVDPGFAPSPAVKLGATVVNGDAVHANASDELKHSPAHSPTQSPKLPSRDLDAKDGIGLGLSAEADSGSSHDVSTSVQQPSAVVQDSPQAEPQLQAQVQSTTAALVLRG